MVALFPPRIFRCRCHARRHRQHLAQMDDHASEFLDSRQPLCELFLIVTRIENNPAKPDESQDRQETSDGEKRDRKTAGSYRIIAGYVLLGWQSFPVSLIYRTTHARCGRDSVAYKVWAGTQLLSQALRA